MLRKDPTAFRRRFQEYKNGKSIDEIYDGGYIKEPVITPDPLYNEYINSLPDNQRLTEDSQYRLHRYWELNGKPKNFTEAIGKGMFTYDFSDNGWHANSVALNQNTGEYEFMKPNWHDTKMYEDAWYYSKDGELFRSEFTKVPGVAYDKYAPRYSNGKLPRYAKGTPSDAYEDFVDSVIREEGFLSKPKDIGDGKITLGSGLTAQKWRDIYNQKGSWSVADNRRAVKEELANTEKWLRGVFSNYDQLPQNAKYVLMDIGYNVGPSTLSATKSPKFVKAVRSGNWQEAMRLMDWGNNQVDSQGRPFRGLQKRNARRQAAWANAFGLNIPTKVPEQKISTYIAQPDAVKVIQTIPQELIIPTYDTNISPYISGKPMIHLLPRISLPNLLQMLDDDWEPIFNYACGKLPEYSNGKISIKPANRGKLTRLKARTGKSESELYNDGNPAHKKMVVFARNSRHWRH